jgi:alcohol dehydrogenase
MSVLIKSNRLIKPKGVSPRKTTIAGEPPRSKREAPAMSGSEGRFDYRLPTELRFGAGRLREAAELASGLGKRALLVTSRRAMERLGYTEQLTAALSSRGIEFVIYNDVHPNPTTVDVDNGAARARPHRAELVIGLGGGSALDCAKAIAAVAPGNHAAADYVYQRAQPGANTLPVIAIPATADTGSEMNRSCMISDPGRPYKGAVRSDLLFPRYAVVDPLLTHSAGRELTAQTGFDALTHAVESYVSPKAQPICDALALQAIQDVAEFLPVALANPHHARAREKLSLASATMGINLSMAGTCLPHR